MVVTNVSLMDKRSALESEMNAIIARLSQLGSEVLPDELSTLSALEVLEISNCGELESLSEHVLQGLSSLRILMIQDCQKFKYLSEGMGRLTCLERLLIFSCPQFVLPSNMDMDKSDRLPERLKHIPSLQILTVSGCPSLTSLPDWLGPMTSLQKLEIYDCPELSSLPDNFQQLRNLHELRIDGCHKLQKACKEVTGKDWHKIDHVPELKVVAEPEPAFWDKMISLWKMLKRRLNRR